MARYRIGSNDWFAADAHQNTERCRSWPNGLDSTSGAAAQDDAKHRPKGEARSAESNQVIDRPQACCKCAPEYGEVPELAERA